MIFLLIQCCKVGVLQESMLVLIAWKIQMHFLLQNEGKCHGLTIIESFFPEDHLWRRNKRWFRKGQVHHLYG